MAAGSLQRINRFALGEARTHKKFFVIANIILGMGGLLYAFLSDVSSYEMVDNMNGAQSAYVNFYPSWLGVLLLVIGGAIGLIGAAGIFRDMNSVQLGDVQLSLPMTGTERYFSKLLALCYIHIFPVMLWTGVPSLINTLRLIIKGDPTADDGFITAAFLTIMAGTLFVDCLTVLCSVCCGALGETIYFTIITVLCTSIAPPMIWYTLTDTCAGQTTDPGILFSTWTLSFVLNIVDAGDLDGLFNLMIIINCLISAGVMALTCLIYKRRDARTVGTPIANRFFFEIVMFAGLTTVYSLFFFHTEAYIGVIIVAIIYIVIHIIASRGKLSVKNIIGWLIKYVTSTAAYLLLAWCAYQTDGFGIVYHLPSASLEGARVSITLSSYNDNSRVVYDFDAKLNNGISELTDKQVREAARVFQKAIVKRPKDTDVFLFNLNGKDYTRYSHSYYNPANMQICYGTRDQLREDNDDWKSRSSYETMHQKVVFHSKKEVEQLVQELEELGFLVNTRETNDYY
ncbi:MAG: hypothetical protein K6B74_12620 [Ruminococcus sp.]|nr:hypothetical protein [Ruminococcus sp.]